MDPIDQRSTVFDDNPSLDGLLPSGANLGKRRSFLESMRPTSGTAVLTFIAHGTTPFIATFMLIHLTAPATATLGGSSLASQLMLLGREYYQTPFGEKFLVNLPIITHVGASVFKRLLATRRRHSSDSSTPEGKLASIPPRPLLSLLSWTGYASMVLLLPIHYPLHRLFPQSKAADAFGPGQLDMEFVKTGLQEWPIRSWLLYGGLTVAALLHTTDGLFVITRYQRMRAGRRNTWRAMGALASIPVLAGVYVIYKEPLLAYSGLVKKFRAAFEQSLTYRI